MIYKHNELNERCLFTLIFVGIILIIGLTGTASAITISDGFDYPVKVLSTISDYRPNLEEELVLSRIKGAFENIHAVIMFVYALSRIPPSFA